MIVHFLYLFVIAHLTLTSSQGIESTQYGHFYIYYVAKDQAQAKIAGKVLQEAWEEFNNYFHIPNDPIYVFIIRSPDDFSKFTGGRSPFTFSGFAKPARNQIIVKSPNLRRSGEDFVGTLRHELVHIILHRSGIEQRIPLWLNEGIAMLFANEYSWSTRLRMSYIVLSNKLIEYKNLDRELMMTNSPDTTGTAYVQSLYLTQLLMDKLGKEKFWELLKKCRTTDFAVALREVGGGSIEDFIKDFRRSLWMVVILGTLATGSIFTPIAILAIVAYLTLRQKNLRKIREWEEEEKEDEELGIRRIPWEHILSEPYDFENDDE